MRDPLEAGRRLARRMIARGALPRDVERAAAVEPDPAAALGMVAVASRAARPRTG